MFCPFACTFSFRLECYANGNCVAGGVFFGQTQSPDSFFSHSCVRVFVLKKRIRWELACCGAQHDYIHFVYICFRKRQWTLLMHSITVIYTFKCFIRLYRIVLHSLVRTGADDRSKWAVAFVRFVVSRFWICWVRHGRAFWARNSTNSGIRYGAQSIKYSLIIRNPNGRHTLQTHFHWSTFHREFFGHWMWITDCAWIQFNLLHNASEKCIKRITVSFLFFSGHSFYYGLTIRSIRWENVLLCCASITTATATHICIRYSPWWKQQSANYIFAHSCFMRFFILFRLRFSIAVSAEHQQRQSVT